MEARDFFDRLTSEIEETSNRLIDEAVAKDPSLAAIVEKGRAKAATARMVKEAPES